MTKQEFLESYNFAPYDFKEIAELLSPVTDDPDVAEAAKSFLSAQENLEGVLDDIGFEFG